MTKPSIVIFTVLFLSSVLMGCSDAPPAATDSPAPAVQKEAPSPLMPAKWVEGTHYNVIAEEVTEQKQVVEYFSFWCPACYRFEAVIAQIKPNLADDVIFKKIHVNFMGFTTKEIQEQATKAMLIGKSLQQEELMTAAIFAHIHEQGQKIGGINDLKELFVSYDFSEEDFENALKSDEVLTAFTNNNAEIDKFKDDLHSVPNIIINGKYQTKFTKEMTIQDIVDLVNWLSQQK